MQINKITAIIGSVVVLVAFLAILPTVLFGYALTKSR